MHKPKQDEGDKLQALLTFAVERAESLKEITKQVSEQVESGLAAGLGKIRVELAEHSRISLAADHSSREQLLRVILGIEAEIHEMRVESKKLVGMERKILVVERQVKKLQGRS